MADQATVSQVHVQVEYDSSPLAKVPQLHVQIEYQNAPLAKVTQGHVQIEYQSPPLAKVTQAHVQVEYDPRAAKNLDESGTGSGAVAPRSSPHILPPRARARRLAAPRAL